MTLLRFLIISIIITLVVSNNTAAGFGNVTLLKGVIKDEISGNFVGTKIHFISPDGKRTSCNSNSSDGSYQQVLTPGTLYTVQVDDHIVTGQERSFQLEDAKDYTEIIKHFTVRKLEAGMFLYEISVFNPNDSIITLRTPSTVNDLKEFMKINNKVHLKITVSTADSWLPDEKVKVPETDPKKKKKSKTKTITITSKQRLDSLLEARISALKNYLNQQGIRETRIEYVKNHVVGKPAKVEKSKSKSKDKKTEPKQSVINNVKIEIGRIMKL
jgi:hypothetical protein